MTKEKPTIAKGIQLLAMALPLLFLGPTVFNMALKNKEHPLFIPVLIVAILLLITAVYVAVKGLRTIMKALFEEE